MLSMSGMDDMFHEDRSRISDLDVRFDVSDHGNLLLDQDVQDIHE